MTYGFIVFYRFQLMTPEQAETLVQAGQEAWIRDHPGEEPIDLRGN